jgi:hypothetical protein
MIFWISRWVEHDPMEITETMKLCWFKGDFGKCFLLVILNNDGATELESEYPILRASENKDLSTPVSSLGNRARFQYCEIILNFFRTCVSSGIWCIFSISHEHWSTCYTNVSSFLIWQKVKYFVMLAFICITLFIVLITVSNHCICFTWGGVFTELIQQRTH